MLTLLFWASLDWAWIGQFGVFQLLDESLFWLQLAMSGFCRRLFYKVGARGGYWLFVSSCWTRQFRSFFSFFFFHFKQLWYQDISIWVWGYKSTTGSGVCFLTETVQRTHTCVCPYCTVHGQKRWCAICTILQKMTAIIHLCQGAARHHGYKQLLKGGCCC